MGIGIDCYSHSSAARQFQQIHVKVLTIGVGVDFHRFVLGGGHRENPRPIRFQANAVIINPATRVTENINRGISQRCQIALRLILLFSQGGMKRADHQIELSQSRGLHVPCALWIEIEFNRSQHLDSFAGPRQFRIHVVDLLTLRAQSLFIDSSSDLQSFRMIGDADIFVASSDRGFCHFHDTGRSIAPDGMHLQITFVAADPCAFLSDDLFCFRHRQKISPNRRSSGHIGRCVDPFLNAPGQIRTNAWELRE